MDVRTLDTLLATRATGAAAVLVTPLGAHHGIAQRLWQADELVREDTALPAAVRAAALTALREDRARIVNEPAGELFVQPFNPPLRLVIVGAVHLAEPLALLAQLADYRVTIVEARAAFARSARFPGATLVQEWPREAFATLAPDARTAIVTLTHDPKFDDPALIAALASPAFYVGALGSKRTHARRLQRLTEAGVAGAAVARIHGPAGLAIGARSPGEIAVSILAQMTTVLRSVPTTIPAAT